jgi:hypothetical protein
MYVPVSQVMKTRRRIFPDLLALAIACIVSLLFAKDVCQFIGSFERKVNSFSETKGSELHNTSDALHYSSRCHDFRSPMELSSDFESAAITHRDEKSVKVMLLNVTLIWKGLQVFSCVTYAFDFSSNPLWNPSIPIAQRKLLI